MNSTRSRRWSRLDNAAKIFPSNSTPSDSKVFRFACELAEPVDPAALQAALERTMERFPLYRSVMKRGAFWYYLEDSDLPAAVQPEETPPCEPIYDRERRSLLFRVLYYGRRISLEIHHALADGTGALQFLCALVYRYLLERYPEDFAGAPPELPWGGSRFQEQADSFQKYYEKSASVRSRRARSAYKLRGERMPENRLAVVEGRMSLGGLLERARSMGLTLTELMTAVLIRSIHEGMRLRDEQRPVAITIPVNLRGYFPSASTRNFFATIAVRYDFSRQEDSLEAVAAHVKRSFRESLTEEKLRGRMNELCALEHSIPLRLVPLPLKDLVLRLANYLADRTATASFSNVGRVDMPAGMERYIRLFDVFTSPNTLQACACSFGDNYVVSFAGPFVSHDVERAFFRSLTGLGIDVTITTNLLDAGE